MVFKIRIYRYSSDGFGLVDEVAVVDVSSKSLNSDIIFGVQFLLLIEVY